MTIESIDYESSGIYMSNLQVKHCQFKSSEIFCQIKKACENVLVQSHILTPKMCTMGYYNENRQSSPSTHKINPIIL